MIICCCSGYGEGHSHLTTNVKLQSLVRPEQDVSQYLYNVPVYFYNILSFDIIPSANSVLYLNQLFNKYLSSL
jgi:hypothetical protein